MGQVLYGKETRKSRGQDQGVEAAVEERRGGEARVRIGQERGVEVEGRKEVEVGAEERKKRAGAEVEGKKKGAGVGVEGKRREVGVEVVGKTGVRRNCLLELISCFT